MKLDEIDIAIAGAIAEEIAQEQEALKNRLREILPEDDDPQDDNLDNDD